MDSSVDTSAPSSVHLTKAEVVSTGVDVCRLHNGLYTVAVHKDRTAVATADFTRDELQQLVDNVQALLARHPVEAAAAGA